MYTVLYEVAKYYPEMHAGFVHVPFLPSQLDVRKEFTTQARYGMLLSDMVPGVQAILDFMEPS